MRMSGKAISTLITICCVMVNVAALAQEPSPPSVSILESRFSTTTPVVGESFTYFLKFDAPSDLPVHPVDRFSTHGMQVLERRQLDPQQFEGRTIQQYEYTLRAQQAGDLQFRPATIHAPGPRQDSLLASADPVQLTVLPVVDVRVETNSPVMLDEPVELQIVVTKRKPVTITSLPQNLEADLQPLAKPQPDEHDGSVPDTPTEPPAPTPVPPPLRFEQDQAQTISPQQQDEQIIERYAYTLSTTPKQAGEY
ncbi:hypothetical protein GF339_15535, partial [candidate division KSB3 bacterium]|nr:hypothetical protein [candidate division KSB3 bacterium]MBD3325996.1 hypothetical protein [candidate division KSB3 bacterium]